MENTYPFAPLFQNAVKRDKLNSLRQVSIQETSVDFNDSNKMHNPWKKDEICAPLVSYFDNRYDTKLCSLFLSAPIKECKLSATLIAVVEDER